VPSSVPDDRLAQKRSDWLTALIAGLHLLVMSYSVLEWRLNETVETAGDVELEKNPRKKKSNSVIYVEDCAS